MVIGVRKVWNIQWEHLWTELRNLYTWVGKSGKDPMVTWTQVLVMVSALECVILEAVWFLSVECWEIRLSFSTKKHPMVLCPAWHTLELVTGRAVPWGEGDWWAEFPACSQPRSSAPHWVKPAKHTATAAFRADLPKSRYGNSISFRLYSILSGNFGRQTEVNRGTSMRCACLLLACAELQLALPSHTWALWRWQAEELKVCFLPRCFVTWVSFAPAPAMGSGCWHLKARSHLAGQEVIQSLLFIHLSSHLGCTNLGASCGAGSGVWGVPGTHFSGCHTPSKGCSAPLGNYFDPWSCNWLPHSLSKVPE